MASSIPLGEAENHLADLLDRAAKGEDILISRDGKPPIRLVPVPVPSKEPRQFGQNFLGITYISPDFDDPLPEKMFDGPIFPPKAK